MNGKENICFHRTGKNVEHNIARPSRKLQQTCKSSLCLKSKSRFCHLFNKTQRMKIFNHFWSVTWEEKKIYFCSMVLMIPVKRKTKQFSDESRRSFTFEYHLSLTNLNISKSVKKCFLELFV